jgi:methionine-gamma-lyase
MKAHSESALAVAEFLESHPKVARVLYPGLASHPQHDLARRQMDSFSGMMAFQVADGPATAARMAARTEGGLQVIHYAVSLGHHRSLIYWIGTDEVVGASFALEGAQLDAYRAFAGDGVFRLSVGLEDPEDICADLDRVL